MQDFDTRNQAVDAAAMDLLDMRPTRAPDSRAESNVLAELAEVLAEHPHQVLETLAERALTLCRAGSCGISLLEQDGENFRWEVIAGVYAGAAGQRIPRDGSPCGAALAANRVLLFRHPEREYEYPAQVDPPIAEALVTPFRVAGEAVGTLWLVAHDDERRFDWEDVRVAAVLSRFAAAAWQVAGLLRNAETAQGRLLGEIHDRSLELSRANLALRSEIAERERAEQYLRETQFELEAELAAARRLHEFGTRLIDAPDLRSALAEILDAAIALHGADMGNLQLYDEERDALAIAAQQGFGPSFMAHFGTVRRGDDSAAGTAWQEGRRVVIENVAEAAAYAPHLPVAREAGYQAVQATPLYGLSGRLLGMLSTHFRSPHTPTERELRMLDLYARQAESIIERLQALESARESREHLALALEAARMGTWEWDPLRDLSHVDARTREILGEPADSVINFAHMREHTWFPEDRERGRAALRRALDPAGDGRYALELRYRRPDGSIIWAAHTGITQFEGEGAARHPVLLMGTILDVTVRKEAEQALRELDRRKDEFIATLAHELRNPLMPISNGVTLLRMSSPANSDANQIYAMMDRQLKYLVRLVDDLLELSRISSGKIELRRDRMDLADALRCAVEASRPLVESRAQSLKVELPETPMWLDGDAIRLAQVFANLLNNAAKYSPQGSAIALSLTRVDGREGAQAEVVVRDRGEGIAPDLLPRIFDMFVQGERVGAEMNSGLGIGLTLARSLVRLHGGNIEAASPIPGGGSQFVVHLPLAPLDAVRSSLRNESNPGGALAGLKVIVLDDNRDAADTTGALLRAMGAEVRVVYDGADLLAALDDDVPDVALVDLGMPRMDGFEVARRVRRHRGAHDMLLVALTGWGQARDRERTREAGFDHHLVKPVDIEELRSLLLARVT